MVKIIDSADEALGFIRAFNGGPEFSNPMLKSPEQLKTNLLAAFDDPVRRRVIGIYDQSGIIGLFSFLVLEDESYLEMLAGLSRSARAYDEMLSYLGNNFPSFTADFVFNPKNRLLRGALKSISAEFEPEQVRLVLNTPAPPRSYNNTVVPYSDKYRADYTAMHSGGGRYWTAEKVLEAADRFRVFVAVSGCRAVGYIDVTYRFDENEPYDILVLPEYRRRGFGTALLCRAVRENFPKKMSAVVDKDNSAALGLFRSAGFETDESGGSVTARLVL